MERTSVLVHLIDAYIDNLKQAYQTIIKELGVYKPDLSKRPQIIVLTKIDGLDKKALHSKLKTLKQITPKTTPVIAISSISGEGVKEFLHTSKKIVDKLRKQMAKESRKDKLPVITLKEDEAEWKIVKRRNTFVVTGKKIERFAVRTHLEDYHGQQRMRDIMAKMGIIHELTRQGAQPGQKIIIGNPKIGEIDY